MECICKTDMAELTKELNGYEDEIGIFYHCASCGRIFYKDLLARHNVDISHWIHPTYLGEQK